MGVARSWDCGNAHKCSRSRGAIFVRTRAMSKPLPKTSPHPNLRRINPAVECRIHHDRARRTNERKKKKEAERRKARSHRRTCKVRRAPCGARSPSGVPLRLSPGRQLVPKAQRQATLLGRSGAFGPVRPPQPGGGDLAPFHGRYPRRKTKQPVPVPVSTSHAGHCAGRLMPDAARVQRGRTLCPRAPQPAPPAGVTGRRPFKQAGCTLLVRRGGASSRNSGGALHLLDPTRYFFRCLFDSRRGNCGIAAMICSFFC